MLSDNLFQKLGIRPGDRICLVEPPADIPLLLDQAAPHGILFSRNLDDGPFAQVLYWPRQIDDVPHHLAQFAFIINPDGAVWLIMPKKKYAPGRGISFSWEEMQAAALETDLVDNKSASFSDTDYATRFVIRKENRHKYA